MRSKVNLVGGKSKKKKVPKGKTTLEEIKTVFTEEMRNGVEVKLVHLEMQEGTVEMGWSGQVRVSCGPVVVGLAEISSLPSLGGRVPLDYTSYLQFPELDAAALDALISNPLLFTLTSRPERAHEREGVVLGQANMDLLPLVLEGGRLEGELVLERGGYVDTLFFPQAKSECPTLRVELVEMGDWVRSLPPHNILWLSVESLFDPGLPYLSPEAAYTLVFPFPRQTVSFEEPMDNKHVGEGEAGGEKDRKCEEDGRCLLDGAHLPERDAGSVGSDSVRSGSASSEDDLTSGNLVLDSRKQSRRDAESAGSYTVRGGSASSEDDLTSGNLFLDSSKQGKRRGERQASRKTGGDKEKLSGRLLDFRLVEFPRGEWREAPTLDLRFRWASLPTSPHSFCVRSDSRDLLSKVKLNLGKKMAAEREPRIVWNMVRPIWLDEEAEQNMIRWIYKYGVWPVELVVAGEPASAHSLKPGHHSARTLHSFIAWLDLSVLLFPGNESVRVAGQLQVFDPTEGEALWGLKSTLAASPAEISLETLRNKGTIRRDSSRKAASCASSDLERQTMGSAEEGAVPSDEEGQALRELAEAGEALHDWAALRREQYLLKRCSLLTMRKELEQQDVGDVELLSGPRGPTMVVVELKLKRPLVPRRSQPELHDDIKKYIPERTEEAAVPRKRFTQSDLQASIVKLCGLISREYNDFIGYEGKSEVLLDSEKFYEHLERSMVHLQISETLREMLSSYILDSVGSPQAGLQLNPIINRDYLDWVYCRLMEDVSGVVGRLVTEGDHQVTGPLAFSPHEYRTFAEEAAEEGDYPRAKRYLNKLLEGEGASEPAAWCSYAVVALRLGDHPTAIHCLREALYLDVRHKESLVMYGVLLATAGLFDAAELFLSALTDFHPNFTQGWLLLHVFYLLIEKKIGADTALIIGSRCAEDAEESPRPDPLAWDPAFLPEDHSLFLTTAIYLLSFNLYEMAEVCLAQDLEARATRTEAFNYYLAVCHHIQGRYEDSCRHIVKTFENDSEIKMEPRVWIVLGHNRWKLGQKAEAVRLYQEALLTGGREELPLSRSTHMALVRCGYYFLDSGKAELSREMFLLALQNVATPLVWMGLGLALYAVGRLEEAELALCEANLQDGRLAVVWAYLGLLALHNENFLPAQQCFFEATWCGLNDPSIEEKFMSLNKIKAQDSSYTF